MRTNFPRASLRTQLIAAAAPRLLALIPSASSNAFQTRKKKKTESTTVVTIVLFLVIMVVVLAFVVRGGGGGGGGNAEFSMILFRVFQPPLSIPSRVAQHSMHMVRASHCPRMVRMTTHCTGVAAA